MPPKYVGFLPLVILKNFRIPYFARMDPKHKLNRYTDEYVDIVLLYPALVVYSLTSKCIQIFLLTVYGG